MLLLSIYFFDKCEIFELHENYSAIRGKYEYGRVLLSIVVFVRMSVCATYVRNEP